MPEETGVLNWYKMGGESTDSVFRVKEQEIAWSPNASFADVGLEGCQWNISSSFD